MLPSRVRIEDNRMPRWTVNYDGKGFVNIEPWKVTGDFSIEINCILDSVESLASLGFKGTTTLGFYHNPKSGLIGANFMTLEGSASKMVTKSSGEFVRNLKFWRESGVCFFSLNGGLRGQTPVDGTFGVDTLGAGYPDKINPSLFWDGKIFDVKLLDLENPLNCRHYNSILNSSCAPNNTYLADSLCQFRKNEWLFRTQSIGQYLEIPPWFYEAGDEVRVSFVLIDNHVGWSYILETSSTYDLKKRPYFAVSDKGFLSWNATIFENPKLDGVGVENGELAIEPLREYDFTIKVKAAGSPIVIIGNHNSSGTGYLNGTIKKLELIDPKDTRNYELTLTSDTQPTITTVNDSEGGAPGVIKGFSRIPLQDKSNLNPAINPEDRVSSPWSNELSTDGEFSGFTGDIWVEI